MAVQKVAAQVIEDAAVTDAKIATGIDATKLTGSIANARIPEGAVTQHVTDPITKSTSEPAVDTNPSGGVGTAWLRTTTGEMYICTDATAGENVWTNVGAGSGGVVPFTGITATGGTVTTDGDYKVHTFTSSADFVVSALGDTGTVEYLVIAGGGAGGTGNTTGGGGAGGYRTATGFSVSATTYPITVGAGGAGSATDQSGADGEDSVFSSITSIGGGGGGARFTGAGDGGSGGGVGHDGFSFSAPGQGTAGQGYDGGPGYTVPVQGGGGGGGASEAGKEGDSTNGGDGGDGLSSSITGSAVTRAGGGGGCIVAWITGTGGSGGAGGGGAGTSGSTANDGAVNTGSGGGGVSTDSPATGASGGSGVVILRYKFQ